MDDKQLMAALRNKERHEANQKYALLRLQSREQRQRNQAKPWNLAAVRTGPLPKLFKDGRLQPHPATPVRNWRRVPWWHRYGYAGA